MRRHRRPTGPAVPPASLTRSVIVSNLKPVVVTTAIVLVAVLAAVILSAVEPVNDGSGSWGHAASFSGMLRD